MQVVIDQMQRELVLKAQPLRIVSLVPSQTEFLFEIGLADRIVGITKFCIHPASAFETTPKVGGTKDLNIDKIKALQPDLIIANKEENEQEQIEELAKHFPVWVSDIATVEDAMHMMQQLGTILEKSEEVAKINQSIQDSFKNLPRVVGKKVLYFIWRKPYMVAGTDTFIHALLQKLGFENAIGKQRYPEITATEIQQLAPDIIYLSSEPYPFKQQHIEELQAICPKVSIQLVDGEMFSWYGSRLQYSAAYFHTLIG